MSDLIPFSEIPLVPVPVIPEKDEEATDEEIALLASLARMLRRRHSSQKAFRSPRHRAVGAEVRGALKVMFMFSNEWDARDAIATMKSLGISASGPTIGNVRRELGIQSIPSGRSEETGGINAWKWVLTDPENGSV